MDGVVLNLQLNIMVWRVSNKPNSRVIRIIGTSFLFRRKNKSLLIHGNLTPLQMLSRNVPN